MDNACDKNLALDWKECLEWIRRCGFLIGKDSKINNEDSALYLLFEMIDGLIPLNILTRLSDYKIDLSKYREYTSNPKESQFHCLKNLKLFNKLAIEYFDVNDTEVVQPDRLYHGREFGKFILLLSKISKSKYSKVSGIMGFPSENHAINAEHEYYMVLGDLAAKSNITMRRTYAEADDRKDSAESRVYDSVVGYKCDRRSVTPVIKTHREMCIMEIVESEKNYVDALQILIHRYRTPMSSALSQAELECIFKYIEELYAIHVEFYKQIVFLIRPKAVNVTHSKKLHDVFIETKPNMLIYGKYCGNMEVARDMVLDIVKTNSYKKAQFERCQEFTDNFRMFPLSDLLTLPMQRVLRYHLLLQATLKATDDSHEDKEGLRKAHEAMLDVARFVNDVKRDLEVVRSIDKIQSEMIQIHLPSGKKLSDYGRRQKDGELKIQFETDVKPRLRHIFIFDKMILIAKRKSESYDFQEAFYLQEKAPEEANIQPRRQEKVYAFKITVGQKRDEYRPIILLTKSEEMRSQWMAAVNAAIENQYPLGHNSNGYSFCMATFTKYEVCSFCNKLLSGAFYQGYLCKITGKVSHKECIPSPCLLSPLSIYPEPKFSSFSTFSQDVNELDWTDSVPKENNYNAENNGRTLMPIRDNFNMVPFVDISQSKAKARPKMESYENEPWFVGEMEREEANDLLGGSAVGTFLIRISRNHRRQGEYSLSIKDNEPRHMKIQKNATDNTVHMEDFNKFKDLRELVKYYSKTCLNEYFDRLKVPDLKLAIPLKNSIDTQVKM